MSTESNNINRNFIGMQVIKRNGKSEAVSFDKILKRIQGICTQLKLDRVNSVEIAQDTIQRLHNNINTEELDLFAANKSAEKILDDPQYNYLASGICISNLHKSTPNTFMEVTDLLYKNKGYNNKPNPLLSDTYYKFVSDNIERLEEAIDYNRDFLLDFFSIKTLERYLNKIRDIENKSEKIIERPQHMFMRVSVQIHLDSIDDAIETYYYMSNKKFIHASPTLFNAGSRYPQCSSCYLLGMDDSVNGMYRETISDIADISKWGGGIGVHLQDIRCKGSIIRGTNGISDGQIPLIKVLNAVAKHVNQSGRRNGAIAVYTEPWHPDIEDFLDLRKKNGEEDLRARDIFLALWIPDIFMRRVFSNYYDNEDDMWSLFCPDECPGLTTTYGEDFEKLYLHYEKIGKYRKRVNAAELFAKILSSQIETGMPYMLYKDNINRKSNQKNIGIIQSSNLCTEITEYSDPDETAVCNLASLCLPSFIKKDEKNDDELYFDYEELYKMSKIVTKNLNKVIDINWYPIEKAKKSNLKHRPIGLGVQGLADVYCMLKMPFDSDIARDVNKRIFETIYFGSLTASNELAKKYGAYETFNGSPFSEGKLQFHLWGINEDELLMDWDWKSLINNIKKYGVRNSLTTSLMPTASTSQILGSNECFEPYTTHLYTRSTLAGEYIIINKHLVDDLIKLNLWNSDIKNEFLFDNGSIQNIKEIPQYIKDIYKTAFEMDIRPIIDQAIDRAPFIDQSQSMNIFLETPDFTKLTTSHYYSWVKGLKTGMYYLRTRTAVDPIKFGLDPDITKHIEEKRNTKYVKVKVNAELNDNYVPCEMCSG